MVIHIGNKLSTVRATFSVSPIRQLGGIKQIKHEWNPYCFTISPKSFVVQILMAEESGSDKSEE